MIEISSAQDFWAIPSRAPEAVAIKDWCCTIYIRDMSGGEVEHIGQLRADSKRVLPWLLKYSVCSPAGKDLFVTISDAERACNRSAKGIHELVSAINRRNMLDGAPEGNLPGGQSEDSPSD